MGTVFCGSGYREGMHHSITGSLARNMARHHCEHYPTAQSKTSICPRQGAFGTVSSLPFLISQSTIFNNGQLRP